MIVHDGKPKREKRTSLELAHALQGRSFLQDLLHELGVSCPGLLGFGFGLGSGLG